MSKVKAFKWYQYEPAIILWCIRWYLQTALTYRQLQSILAECGLLIVHTSIMRWVHRFGPELNKQIKPYLKKRGIHGNTYTAFCAVNDAKVQKLFIEDLFGVAA